MRAVCFALALIVTNPMANAQNGVTQQSANAPLRGHIVDFSLEENKLNLRRPLIPPKRSETELDLKMKDLSKGDSSSDNKKILKGPLIPPKRSKTELDLKMKDLSKGDSSSDNKKILGSGLHTRSKQKLGSFVSVIEKQSPTAARGGKQSPETPRTQRAGHGILWRSLTG